MPSNIAGSLPLAARQLTVRTPWLPSENPRLGEDPVSRAEHSLLDFANGMRRPGQEVLWLAGDFLRGRGFCYSYKDCTARGEVSERFKEHAWKACVGEILPWVQIPPSPPESQKRVGFPRLRSG